MVRHRPDFVKEETMKKVFAMLAAFALEAASAWAGGGLGFFGTYLDSKDPGTAYGGGAKLQFFLGDYVTLETRGSYLTQFETGGDGVQVRFEDLVLIPAEVDLLLTLPVGEGPVTLYAGGGGGYYFIPEYDLVESAGPGGTHQYDLEDTLGFFGLGGIEIALSDSASLFVEGQYRFLEVKSAEVDGAEVDFAGDSTVDFTGISGNAGLLIRF
jgi:hypothetical protein